MRKAGVIVFCSGKDPETYMSLNHCNVTARELENAWMITIYVIQ